MDKLFYAALEHGLLINPGNIYDKRTNQYIRLSFAYASEADLVEGIAKLSKLVKQTL
jgi:GntR family transcriptional regulator, regulator for abcA and norABC